MLLIGLLLVARQNRFSSKVVSGLISKAFTRFKIPTERSGIWVLDINPRVETIISSKSPPGATNKNTNFVGYVEL